MKRILVVTAAVAALGFVTSAYAADMPVKAPMAAPVPVYNWTGLYVGGVAGFVTDFNPVWDNGITTANLTGNTRFSAGGTVGYNWQMNSWLLGVEADWAWTDASASTSSGGCGGSPCTTTINNVGTARGRVGYLLRPALLVYGTGGYAWANIHHTFLTSDIRTTDGGWVVGGGAEWMLDPHWTVKAEYLRLSLNSTLACGAPTCFANVNTHRTDANMFRVGANYLFNWPR